MKTKTIFKTLALAMLMPAMLLTTACSSEDEIVNTENPTNTKGYALPITINVTRQGDATTRATFDGSKLSFSTGDKLFVSGSYNEGDCTFAGMLDYVSDGTFSGTIMTQTEWTGTTEELLSEDGGANATLLPAGYGDYGYLSITDEGTYEAYLSGNSNKAFATSKATAVEQFSYEYDYDYSSGFALRPSNAILNFTINGLDASTEVDVSFSYPNYPDPIVISGKVTTDGDGTATFAIGMIYGINLKDCTLTVDGNAITLPADKEVEAGKIYNVSRSVAPAGPTYPVALSAVTADYTAQDGDILTGTLGSNVKISIADGASVTLKDVTINGVNDTSYKWAGITCLGDATITLEGTNTVKGFDEDYPGIHVPEGKTLTINGTGSASITASSNGYGAGIGGGNGVACGNIVINGGTVTATGGDYAAGIGGGDNYLPCGNIVINGGTVTATGGYRGAGIGSSNYGSCGTITISGGTVTATGGTDGAGIGSGETGSCGAITISGGTVTATGIDGAAGIGGGYQNGDCGTITIKSTVTKVTATKGSYAPYSIGAGNDGAGITVKIEAGANVTQN